MVAALYVQKGGVYYGLEDVDPWDEKRDARQYDGPYPVVAHPPCARWCQMAALVEATHGYAQGDDGGCFEHALAQVRKWGGVLEHPAHTRAWPAFGMPKPKSNVGWTVTFDGEAVCYVEQEQYGHAARKPTWLYAYGVDVEALRWSNRRAREGDAAWWVNRPVHGAKRMRGKRASATPIEFRDALLRIARSAYAHREAA